MIEVMKKGFQRHIKSILPVMRSILQLAVKCCTDSQLDLSNDIAIPLWKEAYYSLVMLEKMLQQFHELCLQRELEVHCSFILWMHKLSFIFLGINVV